MSKFHSHEKEIKIIKELLPTKRLVLETEIFGQHLMKDPTLAYRPWVIREVRIME